MLASLAHASSQQVVDVTNNNYGVQIIPDGVTDNCQAYADLQARVPDYVTFYHPAGYYYVSPANCPSGIVLSKHISILGESSGSYDKVGDMISPGTTVFLSPIVLNEYGGTSVRSVALDARNGVLDMNNGISTGAPSTLAGSTVISDVLYVGSSVTYFVHPVHAILLQSGPGNTVTNVRVYYAFHAVADRTSNSFIANIYTWNCFDVVVKSYSGSGSADGNTLEGLTFDGDPGAAGMLIFTAEAQGVETANNFTYVIHCHNSPYCVVFEADHGGAMSNIRVDFISDRDGGTVIYTYFGDQNPGNSMSNLSFDGVWYWNVTGTPPIFNSANASSFSVNLVPPRLGRPARLFTR